MSTPMDKCRCDHLRGLHDTETAICGSLSCTCTQFEKRSDDE